MARSEGAALIGVNWLASKRQRLPSLTQTSRFTRIGVPLSASKSALLESKFRLRWCIRNVLFAHVKCAYECHALH